MVGSRSGTERLVRDAVHLSVDLTCIVGLQARERVEPQRLRLRVALETDLEAAGATGLLWHSVDYGAIDDQIRFLATEGRFVLLESLALAVARFLLLPPAHGEHRAPIAAVEVTVEKPDILPSSVPSVQVRRTTWEDEVLVDLPEVFARRRTLGAGERMSAEDGVAWGLVGLEGRRREAVGPAVVLEVRQRAAGRRVPIR